MQSSKAFDTHGVLSTPASDVHEQLKMTAQRLKLQEGLLTIQKKIIIIIIDTYIARYPLIAQSAVQ